MKIKLIDYLINQLNKLGIEEIFGLPGDFNFEIVEAIERNKNVSWIGSTNELNAGYSADGYARIKGYGAVVTTYGVGELSAINAIAGCMSENLPVVQITGVPSLKHIENKTLLHHNLDNADYKAFYRAYSNVVEACAYLNKENAKSETDRILNVLVQTKKPVYIAIPIDVCSVEIEDSDNSIVFEKSNRKNLDDAVEEIIKVVKNSKKPMVLADISAYRYNAKESVNNLLLKTNIPSCSFVRGMDIINSDIKNYLGVYCGKTDNKICYDYLNSSDCILAMGTVISDLNTMGFDFSFKLSEHINIQSNYTEIRSKRYDNVLIKDVIDELSKKLDYKSNEDIKRTFKYQKAIKADDTKLNCEYIYSRLNEFYKENDIIVAEVGLVPFGIVKSEFPKNVNVQTQTLWGSIGWATPCTQGCCMAGKNRRTILITGDGSHQLTAQEISTMMRNNLKPIIFVINNSGYSVERILCDDPEYKYNEIASWNYSLLPKVFKGDCFIADAKTNKEFNEVLKIVEKEQKNKMCYIELFTDYLDIPSLALGIAKHPSKLKNRI